MKKRVSKLLALGLAAVMTMSMAACGGEPENPSGGGSDPQQESKPEESTPEESTPESSAPEEVQGEADLFPAYDFGGATLTILNYNDLAGKNPDAEGIEDFQVAERKEEKERIEQKYNVKLEFVNLPTDGDWNDIGQGLVTAYTGGSPVADVMMLNYQFMGTCVANNILVDMTDAFNSADNIFTDDNVFEWTSRKWGICSGMAGEGLYYNKGMIKDAGMELTPAEMFDQGKWDYDSCYEYLKELKSKMGADEYPLYVSPGYWMLFGPTANGISMLASDGNLNYLHPAVLESFEFLQKLINEGICAKATAVTNDDGSTGYDTWGYPGATFDQGNTVAIAHRAGWQMSYVDPATMELGFVPYPWGSNVTIDESKVGTSGAYKTLSSNYGMAYFDGQCVCLSKGVEAKADPYQIQVMIADWMGWKSLVEGYVSDEAPSGCSWLEEGLDMDLYYYSLTISRAELYDAVSDSIELSIAPTGMMYNNTGIRSSMQSFYQQDMQAMIEAKYATEDVVDDTLPE